MNNYFSNPVRMRHLKEKVYPSITHRKGNFQEDGPKPLPQSVPGLSELASLFASKQEFLAAGKAAGWQA